LTPNVTGIKDNTIVTFYVKVIALHISILKPCLQSKSGRGGGLFSIHFGGKSAT
jgi:hypothetical protein